MTADGISRYGKYLPEETLSGIRHSDGCSRETIKRVLSLPADTNLEWRSHDSNISQKSGNEHGRSDKPQLSVDKLRNASSEDQEQSRLMPV